jgi:hypothetical protein
MAMLSPVYQIKIIRKQRVVNKKNIMDTPAITKVEEVIKFLKDNNFDVDKICIKANFNKIDNILQRVNTPDKKFVACAQTHEVKTVVSAIEGIISPAKPTNPTVKEAVEATCEEFKNIGDKPRIPFYVAVLKRLSY